MCWFFPFLGFAVALFAVIKYPGESDLQKKGFILAYSSTEIQSVMTGKAWKQSGKHGGRSRSFMVTFSLPRSKQMEEERPGNKSLKPTPVTYFL